MIKVSVILLVLVLTAGFVLWQNHGPMSSAHEGMDHTSHAEMMADEDRQAEVAERGIDVMPFSLHATKHHFVKNATGGTQQVVVRVGDDVNQIKLIRSHLKEIREQFLQGDFSGPGHIHGNDMPGLQELKESEPGQVTISYEDIESGAELTYSTTNAKLVKAIHTWFDAQVSDHGRDAS